MDFGTAMGNPLGLLGMGASSAASYLGQRQTNKMNVGLAREQMMFQERMANTSYQRAVKDLEKAGLNPLLAVGAQAGMPGGASTNVESAVGKGVASALEAKRLQREFESMDAQIDLLNQQRLKTKAETTSIKGKPSYGIGLIAEAAGEHIDESQRNKDAATAKQISSITTASGRKYTYRQESKKRRYGDHRSIFNR